MHKINNFEQKYMEKSWNKETHQPYKTSDIDDSIKDFCSFFKSKKNKGELLDLGCGNGKNTIFFQKNKFESTGVDFSKSAIKICKQTAKELGINSSFNVGSVLNFDSKKQFDIIIDCGCLHHIRRSLWSDYKKTILKNLKVGGYYYLHGISNSVENKRLPKHPNKRNWIINKKGHYTTFFSKDDIFKLLGKKFKIIKTYDFKSRNSPLMVKAFYIQRIV